MDLPAPAEPPEATGEVASSRIFLNGIMNSGITQKKILAIPKETPVSEEKQDMDIAEKEQINFHQATCCYLCKNSLQKNNYKVRDHCRRTGEYRGAAHNMCNINFFSNRCLPVFLHSLKGYDGHLIIREANSK